MTTMATLLRGDTLPQALILPEWDNGDNCAPSTNTYLIGREKAKMWERLTFLIDGFDPRVNYFVDFGDGHSRRILGRKFHYQYDAPGLYTLILTMREGDQILPVCEKMIDIQDFSWKSILHSLNLF
jgi:hypothetical protein